MRPDGAGRLLPSFQVKVPVPLILLLAHWPLKTRPSFHVYLRTRCLKSMFANQVIRCSFHTSYILPCLHLICYSSAPARPLAPRPPASHGPGVVISRGSGPRQGSTKVGARSMVLMFDCVLRYVSCVCVYLFRDLQHF